MASLSGLITASAQTDFFAVVEVFFLLGAWMKLMLVEYFTHVSLSRGEVPVNVGT